VKRRCCWRPPSKKENGKEAGERKAKGKTVPHGGKPLSCRFPVGPVQKRGYLDGESSTKSKITPTRGEREKGKTNLEKKKVIEKRSERGVSSHRSAVWG